MWSEVVQRTAAILIGKVLSGGCREALDDGDDNRDYR